MLQKFARIRRSFLLLFGILAFSSRAAAKPLSVGTIGSVPSQEIQKLQPFTRYLEQALASSNVDGIKIVVAKNIPQMVTLIRQKKVDLYLDTPFPAVAVSRLAQSRMILQAGKDGSPKFYSVIFVRKDSGLMRLKDLMGEKIAFELPSSTYGYWLPKNLMVEKQYKLKPVKNASDRVRSDKVGTLFSGDNENTLLWVKKRKVKAGAVDQFSFKREEKDAASPLRALDKTVSLPPRIISLRNDLDPSLSLKIQETLLNMYRSEEGKETLKAFDETTPFEPITRKAMDALLKAMGDMSEELKRLSR